LLIPLEPIAPYCFGFLPLPDDLPGLEEEEEEEEEEPSPIFKAAILSLNEEMPSVGIVAGVFLDEAWNVGASHS